MTTIIKSKGSELVCLMSEMEKPNESDFYKRHSEGMSWGDYLTKQYQQSFKPYDIRKEDEEGFRKLAFESYCNKSKVNSIEQALSEGIEIDASLVEVIKECEKCPYMQTTAHYKGCLKSCPAAKEYATLKPTSKESLQVDGDWISVNDRLPELYKMVLVTDENSNYILAEIGGDEEKFFESRSPKSPYLVGVTHWMPLPIPPIK